LVVVVVFVPNRAAAVAIEGAAEIATVVPSRSVVMVARKRVDARKLHASVPILTVAIVVANATALLRIRAPALTATHGGSASASQPLPGFASGRGARRDQRSVFWIASGARQAPLLEFPRITPHVKQDGNKAQRSVEAGWPAAAGAPVR